MGCFWPPRMSVIFSLMSRAALAGFGQVRCGNGGGSWVVLGAQEKGSRASRGTIQLEMLVPNPLEWKGPYMYVGERLVVLFSVPTICRCE
jgi:hypothetical protein